MHEDFYLGDEWLIQPSLNRISNEFQSVRIPAKYMHVLVCLAARPGEAVSRGYLMETVWKETLVVEESLTRAISELRKLLNDDPRRPHIIETIPKIGYRLIASIQCDVNSSESGNPSRGLPDQVSRAQTAQSVLPERRLVRTAFLVAGLILLSILIIAAWNSFHPPTQIAATSMLRSSPLTSYQGLERQPALSPDGQKLAFIWNGGSGQVEGIYVKDIGSELSRRLTDDVTNSSEPIWSPDGRFLAYVGHSSEGCKIFKVPASGGLPKVLAEVEEGAHPFEPSWSPDGNWLAYAVQQQPESSLYLLSLETLVSTSLETGRPEAALDHKPVFAPSSDKIAFLRTVRGETSIHVISVGSGEVLRLAAVQQTINGLDWMPDGRAVVYASGEGIWKLPLPGGKAELVAALGGRIGRLAVAQKARRIAYEQYSEESNIWQISFQHNGNAPKPVQLIGSSRADEFPSISPDGEWIAFVSDRTGSPQIWKSNWARSQVVALTNWNEVNLRTPSWSPDGRLIAFAANPDGQFDIFVVSSDGGEPQRLTTTPTNENAPTWSRNGRWIYVSVQENGCWRINKISTLDRSIVSVVSRNSATAMESPDGQWLYFAVTGKDTTEFWRQPYEGGAELVWRFSGNLGEDWKVCDKGIYFTQFDASCRPSFNFFSFETSRVSQLFSPTHLSFNFDVTSDGHTLIFDQFDRNESDIMMLENF